MLTCKSILSALHNQMHSKVMMHRYICEKSPAYSRYIFIDTSVKDSLHQNGSIIHQYRKCTKAGHWVIRQSFKVIPLKLFYYQTVFETWRNEHSWYEHYKNAIKIWGHRACLRVSRLLNWGIFTGCALKVWITFIQY